MPEAHHKQAGLPSEQDCPNSTKCGHKIGRVSRLCRRVGWVRRTLNSKSLIGVAKIGSRTVRGYQWFPDCGDGSRSCWWSRGGKELNSRMQAKVQRYQIDCCPPCLRRVIGSGSQGIQHTHPCLCLRSQGRQRPRQSHKRRCDVR